MVPNILLLMANGFTYTEILAMEACEYDAFLTSIKDGLKGVGTFTISSAMPHQTDRDIRSLIASAMQAPKAEIGL